MITVLLRGSQPQIGCQLLKNTFYLYYGINRLDDQTWQKIQNNTTFYKTLMDLEAKEELEFIVEEKGEDLDDITTVKPLEKAVKLAKYEFNPNRLRRWLASEKRPQLRGLLDLNLQFIHSRNLENESRSNTVRKFMVAFKEFETMTKNKKQQYTEKGEW